MKQLVFLWDVDGVLVDSEPLHVRKLIEVTRRHGVLLKEEDFARPHTFWMPDGHGGMKDATMPLHGAGDKNIYWWTLSKKPELAKTYSQQQWLDELLEYYVANKSILKPREHMVELVNRLDADGAFQAAVTNGIPRLVEANMSVLGDTAKKMAFTLTADDVKHSKPSPEGYLKGVQRAADRLAAPDLNFRDLVFGCAEDSPVGVQAAMSANIFCVQYLLPGQAPAIVAPDRADKFAFSHTGRGVEGHIYNFYDAANKGKPANGPGRPESRGQALGGFHIA